VGDVALIAIGIAMGFAMGAPVGPANIMCLQRAIQHGFWAGITAGAGVVLGDTAMAAVAAFGITAVAQFIEGHTASLQVFGGLILVVIGIYMAVKTTRPQAAGSVALAVAPNSFLGRFGAPLTSFALTVTNPATLFVFLFMFSALGAISDTPDNYLGAALLVLSIAAGSVLWWVSISALVNIWRDRITDVWMKNINRLSGLALAVCGLYLLGGSVFTQIRPL
jgi:threonine/homoserine/homoserine lactone efflux protein